jgi:hypothetical protein
VEFATVAEWFCWKKEKDGSLPTRKAVLHITISFFFELEAGGY